MSWSTVKRSTYKVVSTWFYMAWSYHFGHKCKAHSIFHWRAEEKYFLKEENLRETQNSRNNSGHIADLV